VTGRLQSKGKLGQKGDGSRGKKWDKGRLGVVLMERRRIVREKKKSRGNREKKGGEHQGKLSRT